MSLFMRAWTKNARNVVIRFIFAAVAAVLMATVWAGPVFATSGPAGAGAEPAGPEVGTSEEVEPAKAQDEMVLRHSYRDQLGRPNAASRPASVMPYQPFTDWSWSGRGYNDTTETLTIDAADPNSHFYWAYDFSVGGDGVGYTGLQTGSHPTNSKIALFAIWGADGAQGSKCGPFDGEGVGWTCRIDPFNWALGRQYALRVVVDGGDSTGTWYKATIRDVASGALTTIGRIHHPFAGGKLTGRGSWTEWFGAPSATCGDLKRSRVRWGLPTSNGGQVKTTGHVNHVDPKDGSMECSGSTSVTDEDNSVGQKVGPK